MTLEEAIQIKEDDLYKFGRFRNKDLRIADKISIVAMKRLKDCQEHHCTLSNLTVD